MKIKSSLENEYNKSTITSASWIDFSTTLYFTTDLSTDDYSYTRTSRTNIAIDIWDNISCIVTSYDSTNGYISLRSTILPKTWGAIVTNYLWDIRDSDWITDIRYNNWILYINHVRSNPEYITYDIIANTYTQFNSWSYAWWVLASDTPIELWGKQYSPETTSYVKSWITYVKYFIKAQNI